MKAQYKKSDVTLEIKEAIHSYLTKRATAEFARDEVDRVQVQLLQKLELYSMACPKHGIESKRILDPNLIY